MKKMAVAVIAFVALGFVPITGWGGQAVRVDVLYMNHGPLQPTIEAMKKLFATYGKGIDVHWHDYETDEGEKFMASKKITEHIPLKIWLDDQYTVKIEGKEIQFTGFPTGAGPQSFQGKWTVDDLRKALDQRIIGR